MKKFVTVIGLLCVSFVETSAQCCPYMDSLVVLPTNPTESDQIRVVLKVMTPALGANLGNSYTISGDSIHFIACYFGGIATQPASFIDTVNIGNLPMGQYHIDFIAYTSQFDTICDSVGFNSTSISFTVSAPTSISSKNDYDALIFPNPVSDDVLSITIGQCHIIQLIDMQGQVQRAYKVEMNSTKTIHLNIKDVPRGIYVLRALNKSGREVLRRKISRM